MYTSQDLDKKLNDEETLFEYIYNTILYFDKYKVSRNAIEKLSVDELNRLINELDDLWFDYLWLK